MIESYDFSKGKGMKREDQKVQKCTATYFWVCVRRECVESYHTRVRVGGLVKTRGGVFTNIYEDVSYEICVCFKILRT